MTRHTAIEDLLNTTSYAAFSGNSTKLASCVREIQAYHGSAADLVDRAVTSWLHRHVRAAWDGGWQPIDLVQFAQRKTDHAQQRILHDVIASENRQYAHSEVDGQWLSQLQHLGVQAWRLPEATVLTAWSGGKDWATEEVLSTLAQLAGFMASLPRLPVLIPPPGDPRVQATPASDSSSPQSQRPRPPADEKVLGRIRSLLAKAESTEFPDEAESLSAKAQEMMTKYSLDRALVDTPAGQPTATEPGLVAKRIWVEAPYASAKTYLVGIVGHANSCKCVAYDGLGFVTVVGEEVDVDLVEVLSTSLLVQAGRAMLRARANAPSRTRSFRRAFLISYANRIGERLTEASQQSRKSVPETDRARLLPALARREEAVDARFAELFPHVRTRRTTVSNPAGWAAGRAAAEQASLNARSAVRS